MDEPFEPRAHLVVVAADDGTVVEVDEGSQAGRLGVLYVRHAPRAIRLAYLLTGDQQLAEDIVQDAFVRLAGRFVDLRAPDAFEAYLRRMIVNLVRMHFRHRSVERAYGERQRDPERSPWTDRDVAEFEAMKTALLALSPRQRAAIVLRFYEDLSEARTADVMGCRVGTVKSLVHQGLETLRSRLGAEARVGEE